MSTDVEKLIDSVRYDLSQNERPMIEADRWRLEEAFAELLGGSTGRAAQLADELEIQDTYTEASHFAWANWSRIIVALRTPAPLNTDLLVALKSAVHFMGNAGANMERDYPEIVSALAKAQR